MLENQCALEIENPEIASPEILTPKIASPKILKLEIVNLETVNFRGEGANQCRGGIEVTSDSLMKDLTKGFVWIQR